jgi:hypothetical protein
MEEHAPEDDEGAKSNDSILGDVGRARTTEMGRALESARKLPNDVRGLKSAELLPVKM